MKRILAVLLVATLAGCLDGGDAAQSETRTLAPGAHWLLVDGNPEWSLENGTATILFLGENQTRLGSLFLENQTSVEVDFAGQQWVAALIQGTVPVKATNIINAFPATPQYEAIPLLVEESPLGQITEPLVGTPPLQNMPAFLRANHTLGFAATQIRVIASGSFTDLTVTVETERGILFHGEESGSINFLVGPTPLMPVYGETHHSAIGGNTLDITVEADHFEGTLLLEALGIGPASMQAAAPMEFIDAEQVAFKYGTLQAPSRVDLHPEAEHLYLSSDRPSKAMVFDPSGKRTTYSFNGTIAIPAAASHYGLVPIHGAIVVGSDQVPQDFEMRLLRTAVTSVSNEIDNPDRFEVAVEQIQLPGHPFLVYPDLEFQAFPSNCNEEAFLELSGPNGTGTLAFLSESLGYAADGLEHWFGQEVTVTKGQARNACHSLILDIHTFTF
ncbi:MAG: hypothetical protein ACPHK8_07400 [Thermoplasmatota archaeon]